MKISTVIFDVDGLMLDTEPPARAAWRLALGERGLSVDDALFSQMAGRTKQDARELIVKVLPPDFPFDEVYARRVHHLERYFAENGIPVKPGLGNLLDYLEAHGYHKAVASSTYRELTVRKLDRAGVLERFEAVVGGDEVTNGKPAPDIFLEAARRLGVQPGECIVLEDSEAGIRAAHAAGMLPVMVPDLMQPRAEIARLAYRILPTLLEVRDFLAAGGVGRGPSEVDG
ncbi:MAG TPA: HAD family phosphatase [Anaerolineales bacterium]